MVVNLNLSTKLKVNNSFVILEVKIVEFQRFIEFKAFVHEFIKVIRNNCVKDEERICNPSANLLKHLVKRVL